MKQIIWLQTHALQDHALLFILYRWLRDASEHVNVTEKANSYNWEKVNNPVGEMACDSGGIRSVFNLPYIWLVFTNVLLLKMQRLFNIEGQYIISIHLPYIRHWTKVWEKLSSYSAHYYKFNTALEGVYTLNWSYFLTIGREHYFNSKNIQTVSLLKTCFLGTTACTDQRRHR